MSSAPFFLGFDQKSARIIFSNLGGVKCVSAKSFSIKKRHLILQFRFSYSLFFSTGQINTRYRFFVQSGKIFFQTSANFFELIPFFKRFALNNRSPGVDIK